MTARGRACGGVVVADARDAAARGGLRAGDRIVGLNGERPARRARPGGRRRRRHALAHRAARRPPARPGRHAAPRGVARHLARPRRARRRPADLPQRLPLLLRRPGAAGPARRALRQGRRLPPLVPARQLHDAHATWTRPTSRASRSCGSRRCTSRCTPGTTTPACASWGGRRPALAPSSSGSRRPASSCTCRSCSARAGTTATCSPRRCARTGELEAVADLGVVPVSLAAEGDLRRVTAAEARAVIAAVEAWQRRLPGAARHGLRARRRRVLPARRRGAAGGRRARAVRERRRHLGGAARRGEALAATWDDRRAADVAPPGPARRSPACVC